MGCTPVCFHDKTNECQFKGKRNLVDKNWGETAINEMPNEEVFDIAMLIIFCFKFIKYVFSRVHEEGASLKIYPVYANSTRHWRVPDQNENSCLIQYPFQLVPAWREELVPLAQGGRLWLEHDLIMYFSDKQRRQELSMGLKVVCCWRIFHLTSNNLPRPSASKHSPPCSP